MVGNICGVTLKAVRADDLSSRLPPIASPPSGVGAAGASVPRTTVVWDDRVKPLSTRTPLPVNVPEGPTLTPGALAELATLMPAGYSTSTRAVPPTSLESVQPMKSPAPGHP